MKTRIGCQHAFLLVALGCVLFVVLTALAMLYYPGGTAADLTTEGYSIFANFFGDLGRWPLSLSGHPNRLSPLLFAMALIAAGGAVALFFIVLPRLLRSGGIDSFLQGVGSVAGVAAGLCLIGVALLPVNRSWAEHNQLATWAAQEFAVACLCYLVVIVRTPQYPKRYAAAFVLFAVLGTGYLAIYLFGPSVSTPAGLAVQATAQKLVVLGSVITLAIQSLGAYCVADHKRAVPEVAAASLSSSPSYA